MKFDTFRQVLGAPVATGGTITFGYPAGRNSGFYRGGNGFTMLAMGALLTSPASFTIAFGATIVVTYNGATTIPAGAEVGLQVNYPGDYGNVDNVSNRDRFSLLSNVFVPFGAVTTIDADGVVASQAATAASGLATGINGALAAGGVATFDVPRNVAAAWTATSVITVTGTDEFGVVIVESSASGTSLAGKKAFKTVTGISVSADVTGLTVGNGKVLGLPFYMPDAAFRLVSLETGAVATAGTVVAGDTATPTALTGDVRGTWSPNGTPNGTIPFAVIVAVGNPADRGAKQFSG